MQAYREPPPTLPPSVVTYYPNGKNARFIIVFALLLAAIGMLVAGWGLLRTTHVRCERSADVGTGSCELTSSVPLAGSTSRTIPLDEIQGTRVLTVRGSKGSTMYKVALITRSGTVPLSPLGTSDFGQRTAAKAALDQFLADATEGAVDVDYDEPSIVGYVLAGSMIVWLPLLWTLLRYAKVEIDWRERRLSIVRMQWPLRSKRIIFALDRVRDALLIERPGKKSTMYSVALEIDDEDAPVRLLNNQSSSGRVPHESVVQEIRALLARRAEMPGAFDQRREP